VLLVLGVPERAVIGIMGWARTSMAPRYEHITDPIRADIARGVGGLIWTSDAKDDGSPDESDKTK
jgi:hypothetical protein